MPSLTHVILRRREAPSRRMHNGHAAPRIHGDLCAKALFLSGAVRKRMGTRISDTVGQAVRRRSAIVLALLACLVIAGCAQPDRSSDEQQQPGGFYGGVSGGM